MQRADRIIVAGIAISGLYGLVLLPLFPLLGSSHPALLELVRGSTASIINMGARASVGQTSFVLAVVLGVPSVMMFDWVFWWAGRRWGDRVFVWLLGRDDAKGKRRLARLHALERRFGALAVVLAPVLPIPSALIYAAVGDGGMRLATFLVLDVAGRDLARSIFLFFAALRRQAPDRFLVLVFCGGSPLRAGLVLVLDALLEVLDAFAEPLADVGQPPRSKKKKGDERNEKQLAAADPSHE